ncbi:MAG: hypothetical protein K6G04_04680 [Lachnospiraceae bacterium]|nr:hypothetical protein [Lachnospiraceae bacterium]
MIDQFDHYITKNIRSFYERKLVFPIVVLVLLLVLSLFYPVKSMIFPSLVPGNVKSASATEERYDLGYLYNHKQKYVYVTLEDLYFTGYRKEWLGSTDGYYYYTLLDDDCLIVLLEPESCQQGISTIDQITIQAEILKNAATEDRLLDHLAEDLSWSKNGITENFSSYMLSEPDCNDTITNLLRWFIVLSVIGCVGAILLYLLFILVPTLSPPVLKLNGYGKRPRKILEEAEEELATLPQLATEDMFITEHYFIETSSFGVAIVPIQEIIWIYKYSTLHKLLWHHFSISYTLHITAKHRRYIRCPKNIKSDIDGIMDYLAEANHDILVGFSEENRQKVEELQGDTAILRKIWAFLSKRV